MAERVRISQKLCELLRAARWMRHPLEGEEGLAGDDYRLVEEHSLEPHRAVHGQNSRARFELGEAVARVVELQPRARRDMPLDARAGTERFSPKGAP